MQFVHVRIGALVIWLLRRAGSECHGNVNVFENLARGDAQDSVARLDQIVAFSSAMLTAEVIGETEA